MIVRLRATPGELRRIGEGKPKPSLSDGDGVSGPGIWIVREWPSGLGRWGTVGNSSGPPLVE